MTNKDTTQDWFTIEKIDSQTYAISEYGHWEQTHCYFFIGTEKAALIDTGTGIGDIRKEVEQLTDLPIIVITTHCHWDHIGGHHDFETIGIHEDDQTWLEQAFPLPLDVVKESLVREPFTAVPPADFSLDDYQIFVGKAAVIFTDGDEIDIGGRILKIIHTPGHAPGHICLYEEKTGYLVTADILYEGTVYAHYESTNPKALRESISKLIKIPKVSKLLPGHNRLHIPTSYLTEFHKLCQKIEANHEMKHGSGLQQGEGVSLLL